MFFVSTFCYTPRLFSDLSLVVLSMDLLSSKTGQNRKEHHTEQYYGNELIIRRGQTFQIMLDLSRHFNINTDKLHLELKTGQCEALDAFVTDNIFTLLCQLTDFMLGVLICPLW